MIPNGIILLNKITGTKSNLIKFEQSNSIVLMFFPDVLKFLNRLGVRPVNDVTAQVTAGVTAGMDLEGMGAHMGAGLQVVETVPFDQGAIIQAMTTVINTGNNSVMTHCNTHCSTHCNTLQHNRVPFV